MSSSNCCFLTCIQISQVAGQVVGYSHLFRNFPVCCDHRIKASSVVSETEVDVFLEFPCFFYDPVDIGNLISGSSAFSKSSLNIWLFLVHVLLKPSLENFEHYFAIMWNEHNCTIVWTFLGIALLWNWNENWPFPVLWPLLSFSHLLTYSMHRFNCIIFLNSPTGIPSPPLALFTVMLPKAPSWVTALSWQRGLHDSVSYEHAFQGHPRQMGHSEGF